MIVAKNRRSLRRKLLYLVLFLMLIVVFFVVFCSKKDDRREIHGIFECVELHSNSGAFITYAIKPEFDTDSTWSYIAPRWFPSSLFFRNKFMWCADSYDFIIYSSDTGLHLYLFDSVDCTWNGDYYLDYVDGQLFYCDRQGIVGEYSQNKLPIEAVEYLKQFSDIE